MYYLGTIQLIYLLCVINQASRMSGVFKSIKDLFVETDEKPKKQSDSPKNLNKKEDTARGGNIPSVTLENNAVEGKVSDKFLDLLFGALEENNLEGFDYLEYKKSLQQLKKMDMDEPIRFQSAYATASTIGATKKILLDSAQVYLNILAKEENKFNDAWRHQAETQIGSKQNRKAKLEKGLTEKKERILKLNEEIVKDKTELGKMDEQLALINKKVNQTKSDFKSSYDYLVDQLVGDIEKMKLYLK